MAGKPIVPGWAVSGIYKITNTRTRRIYVGSAVDINKRWREHLRQLNSDRHHSKFLQRCWNKYGADAFKFSVLLFCDRANLLEYEQRAIDTMKPDYNSAPTAGSQLGFRMSAESKAKLSEAARRTKNFTGKTHSPESRAKISEARKGKGGGYRSPERLKKAADAMRKTKSVLNEGKVREIRELRINKLSAPKIAKIIGCTTYVVYDVLRGRCFSWVK